MTRPMRIMHLLPDMQLGGGQVLLLRNILALSKHGFESTVCSVWADQGTTMTERFRSAGVPVCHLRLRRSMIPVAAVRLLHEVRSRSIDLIHTNNTYWDRRFGAMAGRRCGLPVVNSFHSMKFRPRHRLVEALDALHLRGRFSGAIAVSGPVLEAWQPTMDALQIPRDRVRVISPGLDLAAFRPSGRAERARVRRSLSLRSDAPLLINVARLARGKGHLELIDAMGSVVQSRPDVRLLLVGDGPERASIEAHIARHRLESHVLLLGQRDDIPALLGVSDLFVFTSVGEGFGLVLAEALASGLPVVSFALPVLPEIMGAAGETGVVVEQGDALGLAREAVALLDDEARRLRLGERAMASAKERFSVERAARSMADLYEELLAGGVSVHANAPAVPLVQARG